MTGWDVRAGDGLVRLELPQVVLELSWMDAVTLAADLTVSAGYSAGTVGASAATYEERIRGAFAAARDALQEGPP